MLESSLDLSADGRIELYKDRRGGGMKGELHLTGLFLTAVPPSLASLHGMNNLKELYLAHNKLSTLPEHVTQLSSLEKLDLTSNVLAELPPAIGSLARLKSLHLSRNRLQRLPDAIGELQQLVWLDLRCNALASVPTEALSTMQELATLWLDGNPCAGSDEVAAGVSGTMLATGVSVVGCLER